jgi:hypothetical protein
MSFSLSFFIFYKLNLESKDLIPQNISERPALRVNNVTSYSLDSLQFYPNMRFNHNLITYKVEDSCPLEKKEKMVKAFDRVENELDSIVRFKRVEAEPDILITCNETTETKREEYFVAGEGGAESVVNTSLFYIIERGKVLLYYKEQKSCITYHVELHELLHALGFKHSKNKYSIMYPTTECYQVFTQDMIDELERLYSIEPLPEIYVSSASASKHGMYLDFEIEIKNKGLVKTEDVNLTLFSGTATIEKFKIGDLDYGEGKTLTIKNLKLPLSMLELEEINFLATSPAREFYQDNNHYTLVVA